MGRGYFILFLFFDDVSNYKWIWLEISESQQGVRKKCCEKKSKNIESGGCGRVTLNQFACQEREHKPMQWQWKSVRWIMKGENAGQRVSMF